jgi:hypothetical protein
MLGLTKEMARSMAFDTVAVRLLTAESTEFSLRTHDQSEFSKES